MQEARWLVKLVGGDTGDLERLAAEFVSQPAVICYIESQRSYFLDSDLLQQCATAGEVQALSKGLLTLINGAMRAVDGDYVSVRHGEVVRKEGEVIQKFLSLHETISIRSHLSAEKLDAAGNVVRPAKPDPKKWIELSLTSAEVRELLEYLAYPDQGWVALFWIYEVLNRNAIKVLRKDAVSDLKRFTETANRREAGGDRHATRPNATPVADPMTLEDARSFIHGLARWWLDSLL